MNFKVKNLLKRLSAFSITLSLCATSIGTISFATYSGAGEAVSFEEDITEFKELSSYDEFYFNEEVDIVEVATVSNAIVSEKIVTVTDADEFSEAVKWASSRGTEIIELAGDIYLNEMIEINTSLIFRAVADIEEAILYSYENARHFIIRGGEIQLITENVIIDGQEISGGITNQAQHFIFNGVIQNCHYMNGSGGAILTDGDLTIDDGEIRNNSAIFNGGAISATNNSNIIIRDGLISNNEALFGGGICIDSFSTLTIFGGIISQNIAESGGGICNFGHDSVVVLNDGIISENYVKAAGAGVYIFSGELYINGGVISKNIAAQNGGGIASFSDDASKVIEINNGIISDNKARFGGGFYLSHATGLTINGGAICHNIASETGGGLSVEASELKMNNGKIYDNIAATYGGGICGGSGGIIEIVDGEISNNEAEYGGGGIFSNDIGLITILGDAIVKNNKALQAYKVIEQEDISLHNQQISPSATWTDGFDYIYNNLDVNYTKGILSNPYSLSIEQYYTDTELSSAYNDIIYGGQSYSYSFTIPEGYQAKIEGDVDLVTVDMDAGLITIESMIQDVVIRITCQPVEDEGMHTVTIITYYTDGVKNDESTSYQVFSGESFEETYEALEGYEFAGISVRSYPFVDGDTRTVSIDSVNEDYTITIKLARKSLNVKVTTQYVDGILSDETKFYSVLYGDNFAESYEALEGYAFVGMSVRSYPYVDVDTQMIYIDEIKEDYEIIIKLGRVEYTVTINVQYPEGTIENQVFIYSVLYGDSFEEFFEVELGYRIAAIQTEKGVDVNFQTQIAEIESVKKDMLITIICR